MRAANFGFLGVHDEQLALLGGFVEKYFRGDPSTATVKLRPLVKLLAHLIAAHHAPPYQTGELRGNATATVV